ncbi:hypothetical protein [Crocosphaera chwakensis]|uniref:PEP-CTERM sorting domain-containing protein n=1 Tax=Crocosphaera chwakensis CCY0110 TaxID=391612 RepID=A3INI1_9CHRO|nr:hypothetical protein [Crocosphaera chwakensis]EAZ91879.1 hypothetical protein CY0110_29429 [Crocosphaera chwakensis CCY0110]
MLKLKRVIYWVSTTLSFAVISSAEAVTVNFGDPMDPITNKQNNVLSIDNLEICISGATICQTPNSELTENKVLKSYNVTFRYGSFTNIFGNPNGINFTPSCASGTPNLGTGQGLCFWSNQPNNLTEVILTQTAINEAINTQVATNANVSPPADISALRVPQLPVGPGFPFTPNQNNPIDDEYLIPTGFNGNITYVRNSNETNGMWEPNTNTVTVGATNLRMYTLFEFLGETTIKPPEPPQPPSVPESSSAIAVILTGSCILLTKRQTKK